MIGAGYGSQESYDNVLDADNPYTSEYFYGTPFLGAMGARTGLVDGRTDEQGFYMVGCNGDMGEYYSREEGGINQYDFNMSFNVQDRYYFGVTLGVYDVNYKRYSSYSETLLDDYEADNGNFTLNNWFSTQGIFPFQIWFCSTYTCLVYAYRQIYVNAWHRCIRYA